MSCWEIDFSPLVIHYYVVSGRRCQDGRWATIHPSAGIACAGVTSVSTGAAAALAGTVTCYSNE